MDNMQRYEGARPMGCPGTYVDVNESGIEGVGVKVCPKTYVDHG